MSKIAQRFLLLCLVLTLVACSTDPDVTAGGQDVPEVGVGDVENDVSTDVGDGGEDTALVDVGADAGVPPREEPLDLFVADRTGFDYEIVWSNPVVNVDTWLLNVTSQVWRTEDEVDRTVWTHEVILAAPRNSTARTALVVIAGGSTRSSHMEPDDETVTLARLIAARTGTPVVGISQIPSQPLTILGEAEHTREDDLVAASWHKVLETGDPSWSAYFPMTRGVVRIMDAVFEVLENEGRPVDNYVVTGYSKRGATTYLVAAADERVLAMAPGVFDFLNFRPQAQHHLDVYGEPAPAVGPYAAYDLLERVQLSEAQALIETSDPYAYRDRYTMPKLIIASPGDEFFLPDAMRFYIDEMPGETLVRYMPNTGHGLIAPGGDLMDSLDPLVRWYTSVVANAERPSLSWTHEAGRLVVTATPAPTQVKLWTATNPEARNFRNDVLGPVWESVALEAEASGDFVAQIESPADGFTAYFVEVTFGGQIYSTQVYVTPDE